MDHAPPLSFAFSNNDKTTVAGDAPTDQRANDIRFSIGGQVAYTTRDATDSRRILLQSNLNGQRSVKVRVLISVATRIDDNSSTADDIITRCMRVTV